MVAVSIIVPVYNSERYLAECLTSLVNQTLENIEVICINNGSTDSSGQILEDFADRDSRIMIINKETPDVGGARNTGVRAAAGEYLMFVDSDDWIRHDACERLYGTAQENDLDILQADYFDFPKKIIRHFSCNKELYNIKQTGLDFWKKNNNITGMNWDKIWKRSFFIENKLFNPEGVFYEDGITSVKGYLNAQAYMIIDYGFYFYRRTEGSIMNQELTEKHNRSSLKFLENFIQIIEDTAYTNELCIQLFYLKQLFVHFALFDPQNIQSIKYVSTKKIKSLHSTLPLKIRLAYFSPKIASVFYPLWRRRGKVLFLINNLTEKFSPRRAGRASCRRSREKDFSYS